MEGLVPILPRGESLVLISTKVPPPSSLPLARGDLFFQHFSSLKTTAGHKIVETPVENKAASVHNLIKANSYL
jgi:hypothetical protein